MPKSALPMGTTPHRRKKAPTQKITLHDNDYSFGDEASDTSKMRAPATAEKHGSSRGSEESKSGSAASNAEGKSKSSTPGTDKENAVNGSRHSHVKSDKPMDDLNKSMAKISLSGKQNRQKKRPTTPEPRDVKLPKHAFPKIKSVKSARPFSECIKRLKEIDTKSLTPTLLKTIQQASIKPTASIALDENVSTIKDVVKQCLKFPSLDSLRLAIHSMRAIIGMVNKGTGVKLLFHCCVLSGEQMMKALDAASADISKSKEEEIKWKLVAEYCVLTIAAYQTLGRAIKNKFSWDDVLLIAAKKEILPKRQMVKICLESGIAASSAFMHLNLVSLRGITIENEFGLDLVGDFQCVLSEAVCPLLHEAEEGDDCKFAKRIFRFLWDGARCVNDTQVVLHLQCLAVTSLANFCVEAFPSSKSNKKKELYALWDKASSSTLKTVASFEKQTSDEKMKDDLMKFHNISGGMLDNAWIQFHSSGMPKPPSYFEYCGYRSIHQWKFCGTVDSIHSPHTLLNDPKIKHKDECGESLAAMASYSIILLALEAHVSLTNTEQGSFMSSCGAAVLNFDALMSTASFTSQSRCRSMIMLLNLQREANKIIASHQSDSCSKYGKYLSILGYVLGRCMAPLETKLASNIDDSQKSLNLQLSASDNHAKAAAFLDASLEDSSVSSATREKWNTECVRQIRKGFELLLPILDRIDELESGSPVVLATETFSKTAASIGRKLVDRLNTNSSLECQLYASELLTKLASKCSHDASFQKYHISNRYMLLASAFHSNGNKEECCAAIALAVWGAAKNNAQVLDESDGEYFGDSVSEEILLFPGITFFEEAESSPVTHGLLVMINKLARACIEALGATQSVKCNFIPRDTTLATLLKDATNESKQLSISKLLDFVTWDIREFNITQTLELIRELLKCSSKVLKSRVSSEPDSEAETIFSAMSKELNRFLQLQFDRMANILPSEDLQVISSALRVSFAMSLVDPKLFCFPKPHFYLRSNDDFNGYTHNNILRLSIDQMGLSDGLFADATKEEDNLDACFFVQWAAVRFHQTVLLEHQSISNQSSVHGDSSNALMQQYIEVLTITTNAVNKLFCADEEAPTQVRESIIATLKRLLCRFSLYGDPVSSSQCYVNLQKVYSLNDEQHMLDSVSDFLLISSKFDDLAAMLFRNCLFDSSSQAPDLLGEEIIQRLNQNEQLNLISNCIVDLMISTSQHLIRSQAEETPAIWSAGKSLQHISEFIDANLSRIESDETDEEINVEAIVQIQSLVITTLMLRAKMFLNARQPETSIDCFNACRCECKRMMSLLRAHSSYLDTIEDRVTQINDLLCMGLERLSIAFSALGIRRKAEDSAILAVMKQRSMSIESPTVGKITFQELIENLRSLDGMYSFLPPVRTLIRTKSMSISPDKLLIESALFDEFISNGPPSVVSVNSAVNRSQTLLAFDDSFRHLPDFKSQCNAFLSLAQKNIVSLMTQSEDVIATDVPTNAFVSPTEHEVTLRLTSHEAAKSDVLDRIIDRPACILSSLAEAFFELGLEALKKAKSSNELHNLWGDQAVFTHKDNKIGSFGHFDLSSLPNVTQAKKYFHSALLHANPASNYTTKKILRCLALVTGPEVSSAFLIHASVGGAARNIVRDAMDHGNIQYQIFNIFDDEALSIEERAQKFNTLLSKFSSKIPACWIISAVAICPTGDILITSFRASAEGDPIHKTACIFSGSNLVEGDSGEVGNIHDEILLPLDGIIERSQKQLRGIDEEVQTEKYNDELSKRKWWDERHSIDDDLRSLLQKVEDRYFGQDLVRQMFLPTPMSISNSDDDSSECSISPDNLASRFEAAEMDPIKTFDHEAERLTLKKLTVAALKEKLNSFSVDASQMRKLRKADLIELLIEKTEKDLQNEKPSSGCHIDIDEQEMDSSNINAQHVLSDPCCILILDEHMHRLPLESLVMFENQAITRMPSLPFVLTALQENYPVESNPIPKIDPEKVQFIIDPEQNLSETASKMEPALKDLAFENGWEWTGCVGEMPTPERMSNALTEQNSLLLYCGHGGGEKFFSRSQVEDFINYSSNDERVPGRGCSSVVLLMGCSSGKLKSVNCPKDNTSGFVYPIHYEPEGIALSYIYAGAPCVVGNLWDVTDRDIDRYCLTLLRDFFDHQNHDSEYPSMAKCVALARRACKLRYIVGSAPVCYGIPVQCRKHTLTHRT